MKKFDNVEEFRRSLVYGLNQYQDKLLETFSLGISKDKRVDILKCFEKFSYDIGFWTYKGYHNHLNVQYCIVVVDGWHIHGLIKKPYQQITKVRNLWQSITGEMSNVSFRTLKKETKKDPIALTKTFNYFCEQGSHHDCLVSYYRSDEWGMITPEDIQQRIEKSEITPKEKIEKSIKSEKKKGRKLDPVVMIEKEFFYWSELTDEQKSKFNV